MSWVLLAEGAFLLGDFVYHRWFDSPPKPTPAKSISIPRVDAGAPYALLFGQCQVKAPVLAWVSTPIAVFSSDDPDEVTSRFANSVPAIVYMMDMFFALGIPFADGSQQLLNMYQGDAALIQDTDFGNAKLPELTGEGGFEDATRTAFIHTAVTFGTAAWGQLEFLNGNSSQELVDGSGTPTTEAGYYMDNANAGTGSSGTAPWGKFNGDVDPTLIPGYRGLLSVFLYNNFSIFTDSDNPYVRHWVVGAEPNVPQYSFELKTLPASSLGPNQSIVTTGGGADANPIDILYDILTGSFGKLGLDPSRIDLASFTKAAATLDSEGHGMSRSWEGGQTASEMIQEILRQIDGGIYEDPTDGKLRVWLARNDYDPSTLPQVNPDNCEKIENFACGGWTGVPNKVRITFCNRADGYRDGSGLAQSLANAVGQDGEVREVQLQMPGVCTQKLADNVAERELAAQSRPLIKCTAIVDRTFHKTVPGNVVRLTWPEWGLSPTVMRVANVTRGTVGNEPIRLDLIQDYFYVWRSLPPTYPGGGLRTTGTFAHSHV